MYKFKTEEARKGLYTRQIVLMMLLQFSCFLPICLNFEDIKYILFYIAVQAVLLTVVEVLPIVYRRINRLLINNACLLLGIGLVMISRLYFDEAVKQLIIIAVSFVIGSLIPLFMKYYKRLPDNFLLYSAVGIGLLLIVLLLGVITNGSRLSVSIFGLSFQASEFVKMTFVLFVAAALNRSCGFKDLVITTIIAAAHVLLLALSTDLGAALIYFIVYVLMVYIATRNHGYFAIGVITGVVCSICSYYIFRHVKVRVMAYIDPFSVIDNEGYQITQSLFAISSGGWFGMGLTRGTPESIPYVETDFIFSAITQEMGIIFSVCLILICLSTFLMFVNISLRLTDHFYKLAGMGLGLTYIVQNFLTIGGEVRFIPLSGLTLPFVSYGGSSIMATIFTIMLIEGMYYTRPISSEGDEPGKIAITKQERRNRIPLGITYSFLAVFIVLILYLFILVPIKREEFFNNSYNRVPIRLNTENQRGTIYSKDLEVLAVTHVNRLDSDEKRYYPYSKVFSHVVGYEGFGRIGIEGLANYYLLNSNQPLSDRISRLMDGDKAYGDSVVTTLDVKLQQAAYDAIGTYRGAVVVTDPKTGDILAMVSKPDFDPNELDLYWDELIKKNDSAILLNRATQGLYAPGSTFKIVTLLEYIRENPENYSNYAYKCVGSIRTEQGSAKCFDNIEHGSLDLKKSLAVSCNSSFGNIGLLLDRDRFNKTLNELLFNNDLPANFIYSKSSISDTNSLDDLTMVLTSLGQGDTLVTPFHMNMITQAVANDGVLMRPRIISSVVNCNMNEVKSIKPDKYKRLMSETEANIITEMMVYTVDNGTAKKLKNETVKIAGKTGSAEYSDYSNLTHSWFTGFAPADEPQICVTIILEEAGSGSLYATNVAKKIFDTFFGIE